MLLTARFSIEASGQFYSIKTDAIGLLTVAFDTEVSMTTNTQ